MRSLIVLTLLCSALTAEALTKINIAYSQTVINAQIGLILEKTDILKKHGFEAHLTGMPSGKELKTALIAGAADVILSSESNFIVVRASGFEAYAISAFGSAGKLALVVKNNGVLNKIEDLKGKKIGALFGTTVHQRALEWKNKIDANKIELVNLGNIAALSSALEAGAVDAIMMWDPYLEQALHDKKVKVIGPSEFDLINIMSKSFSDKNPKAITELNGAFTDAFEYLQDNKLQVNKWFGEIVKMQPEVLDASSQINKNYSAKTKTEIKIKITEIFKKNLDNISDFFLKEKVITAKPEIQKYFKEL